ncbi:MAG: SCO family protein [Colwellia sp.]|nr:SCO family protein [Colwellia sp.]
MSDALPFREFELRDHHNQLFTNKELHNSWFLISYGYTQCPDVCPTTLMLMKQFSEKLNQFDDATPVKLIFYTIDPLRDTQQILMQYMHYFGDNFIGLRPSDNDSYLNFEGNLALKYLIKKPTLSASNQANNSDNSDKKTSHQVSHGLTLYLVNPEGKLQAIFQPETDPFGRANFTVDQIYQDFIISRQYYLEKLPS